MLAVAKPRAATHQARLILAESSPTLDTCPSPLAPSTPSSPPAHHAPPRPRHRLRELARITRAGGRLILFHPSGRAALAARHGRTLRPEEPLAEQPLRTAAQRTGWQLDHYDDPPLSPPT